MNLSYFSSSYISKNLKFSFHEFVKIRTLCAVVKKEDELPADEAQEQLFRERQEDLELRESKIEKKRNKSRLYPQHRNMVHNKPPWTEDTPVPYSYIKSVRYNQRLYGRYGNASKVDPRIAWPSKEAMPSKKDYDSLCEPKTILQMAEEEKARILAEEKEIYENDARMAANFAKMDKWKEELRIKLTKQSEIATEAKRKRERLMEEVRRHVGYELSPHDPRFQEIIDQKAKEEKKAKKEAKKKKKQEELIAKMLKMAEDDKIEREKKGEEPVGDNEKPDQK